MGKKWIVATLFLLTLPWAAWAQGQGEDATFVGGGMGFELATRFFQPNDSRIVGGSNAFRINFGGTADMGLFFVRESMNFTFKNSGSGAPTVSGSMVSEGIGLSTPFSETLRLELLVGRATTTVNGAAVGGATLNSSDPLMDLAVYWAKPLGKAFIDLGLIFRTLTLSGNLAGNAVDGTGTTSAGSVDDLGGLLLNLGIGYGF